MLINNFSHLKNLFLNLYKYFFKINIIIIFFYVNNELIKIST